MTAVVPIEEDLKWGRVTGEGARDSALELRNGGRGCAAESGGGRVSEKRPPWCWG